MIFSSVTSSGHMTQASIEHAIRRNFGGLLGANDPLEVFRKELKKVADKMDFDQV